MSINQRVQTIVDELFCGNQRAFARAIMVAPSVVGNIVGKRQSIPSSDFLKKITDSIEDINSEWLLTGKGLMLKPKEAYSHNHYTVSEDDIQYGNAYIPKPFIESDHSKTEEANRFSDIIKNTSIRKLPLPFIGNYDFSLQAHGDSMINSKDPDKSIHDKNIVACKLWDDQSHIRWGEVYALATTEGFIIKKIVPSTLDSHIRCVSFNEEEGYHSYDLPLKDILEWSIVIGVVAVSIW